MFDVVVVGAGPSGLVAAALLGQQGVSVALVERNSNVDPSPRAAAIDGDALRTLQNCGVSEQLLDHVLELPVVFTVGDIGGKAWRDLLRVAPSRGAHGYADVSFFYQPFVEEQLRSRLRELSATVHLFFGWELRTLEQDENGVAATVAQLGTPDANEVTIRARYCLGCDGGSSTVRRLCDVAMPGTTHGDSRWLVVDASTHTGRDSSGVVDIPAADAFRFICGPQRPGVQLPLQFGNFRWEFGLRRDEVVDDRADDESVARLLRTRGVDSSSISIRRQAVYTFHDRVAETWRCGRVLLVGDAAHLLPPFGGQGMTAGIRDASNVAWKLAAVLRGSASAALLDTYEMERRRHVAAMLIFSRLLAWAVLTESKLLALLRNAVMRILQRLPVPLAPLLRTPTTALGGYDEDRRWWRACAPCVGRALVQPTVIRDEDSSLVRLDECLGVGFAVVGIGVDPRPLGQLLCDAVTRATDVDTTILETVMPVGARTVMRSVGLLTTYVQVISDRGSCSAVSGDDNDGCGGGSERLVVVRESSDTAAKFAGGTPETVLFVRPDRMVHARFRTPRGATAAGLALRRFLEGDVPRADGVARLRVLAVVLLLVFLVTAAVCVVR